MKYNHIDGVKVSVLTLNGVDRVLEPCWVKPKTIKLFISASLLSMQQ
jgi:hypothetical protein